MSDRPEELGLEIERAGDLALVRISRRELFDEEEVQALGRSLSEVLRREKCRRVVVSLAAVEGLGSAMLGKLIMIHKEVTAAGGRLALCGLAPPLRRSLEDTRLARYFHIYRDEQEAALSLAGPPAPSPPRPGPTE